MSTELITLLLQQADEIAAAGHPGWGNTMLLAADTIESLQSEVLEQARLNGMGSEREARLMAQVEELKRERNRAAMDERNKYLPKLAELEAKLARYEQQSGANETASDLEC